jgi:hypothetical protein
MKKKLKPAEILIDVIPGAEQAPQGLKPASIVRGLCRG